MIKYIMSSSAYQQSSKTNQAKLDIDPQNIYLARGPRFRLSSEQIRDQGLALSGLLNRKVGGKSVMPYQPENIWQAVYSQERWKIAEDDNRFRRGIYTYWRRTSPYPSMITFDNPSREYCVSRRIRTNTPLQALVTLNDPVFVEISNAMANRMLKHDPSDIRQQIGYGLFLATGKMEDSDIEVLLELYNASLPLFEDSNAKLISNKEESAFANPLAIVANAILNLDQDLNKE